LRTAPCEAIQSTAVETVHYHKFTAILINEVQRGHDASARMEQQIERQQGLIDRLLVRLSVLEAAVQGSAPVTQPAD
jgi:hypothetical protein